LTEWTPDRFAPIGWKYQAKGTVNKFLHHPNKVKCQRVRTQTPAVVEDEAAASGAELDKTRFDSNYNTDFKNMTQLRDIVNTNTLLRSP